MIITQVYAPSVAHDDEDVERFYEFIESTVAELLKKGIVIVQGDWMPN